MLKFNLYPAVPYGASRVRSAATDKVPLVGMRHFVKWCLACILVLCSGSALAQQYGCTTIAGGNYVVSIGTASIPLNAAIGSTVIPKSPQPGASYRISCSNSGGRITAYYKFSVTGAPVSGYTDVYPTNLAGLGVRYLFSQTIGNNCGMNDDQTIENSSYTANCWVSAYSPNLNWSWQASTEFVKTGTIAAGTLTSIPAINITVTSSIDQVTVWQQTPMYTGGATGNVTVPTCATPDVVIPMGNTNFSTFNGTGTMNDRWNNTTFNVNNCPVGLTQVSIKFNTPLAGWLDQDNGVFKLNNPTSSTTAQGIGIQMSFGANNTPVVYNTAQPLSGYEAIKTTGGSFSVPIGARYVKPASTTRLVAGQANGAVVFVMSYE